MPVMRFDKEQHKYYVDGAEYPGVTTVLSAMGLSDNRWAEEHHRRRGSAVHDIASLLNEVVRNGLDSFDSPADLINASRWDVASTSTPLVKRGIAYAKFLHECKFQPVYVEQAVFSTTLKLAGTLDSWGWLRGNWEPGTILLDIKSGAPAPSASIQIALYDHLLHACCPDTPATDKLFALQLKDDETYRIHPLPNDRRYLNLGLSAVNLYHWRQSHNLLPKQNGDNHGKQQSPFGT